MRPPVSDFLTEMTTLSSARARDSHTKLAEIRSKVGSATPPTRLDLSTPGFDLIAEAKLASPSEGALAEGGAGRVVSLARVYESSGAAAVSVLTEETRFGGSLGHLEAAASAVGVPVMRKDFLVDPVQVLEARAAGASGVLLIARLLPGQLLVEMTETTLDLGMFALVEVFDRADIETAVPVFGHDVLVGVNSRDLATLEVDPGRFEKLAPHLPDHLPAVAESGIEDGAAAAAIAGLGYRMALVGSSLVTSDDPGDKIDDLLRAGRDALSRAGR
jgi:indole-3-glycerol phosphate synthase